MRVLVACERSGVVREAFRLRGHDAWSNDITPADDLSPFHIVGDARVVVDRFGWDLIIAHPPCTSARVAAENPIMHRHGRDRVRVPYTQIVQPYQFGHGETKATCLWLRGLPPLQPTNIVPGRSGRVHKLPPTADRQRLRSVTYQGIADAMAEQWGKLS